MAIGSGARATPLPEPNPLALALEEDGRFSHATLQFFDSIVKFINGMSRNIPCSATGTNTITLTPNEAHPLLEKYVSHDRFTFAAAATSTGDVSATVVPASGALATLNVYVDDGATRASTGDVVQNSVYDLIYADHLNAGAGGLVLK